ncbi:MAG TPA: hypothetical protein VGR97_11115, partial [Candidatus Acidoferrales bacterium]|nr:hypothetical protein [Candidatus Acidoferrales bacterium]
FPIAILSHALSVPSAELRGETAASAILAIEERFLTACPDASRKTKGAAKMAALQELRGGWRQEAQHARRAPCPVLLRQPIADVVAQ